MAEEWREIPEEGVLISSKGRKACIVPLADEQRIASYIARAWHGPRPEGSSVEVAELSPEGVRYVRNRFASKLDAAAVREMRADMAAGMSLGNAATKYGVSRNQASLIRLRKVWKDA